ncbi:FGGY-family carbohydrate kinase [Saccharopolyspora sp. ASAGF58]|uniref:xylulokinase n=1 Tax=Saccharopolyspora sp. ASAGF58 TaxID=2719023 RepID=UPI001B30E341|nr:FGGY family carbohydrate kinase [Saccharopolyspora sp. ASAGF58]
MSKYVMTYDCGTTSLKAALIDLEGTVVAEANETYALRQPQPGWAEQDPAELWEAVCRASRRLMSHSAAEDVVACVFVAPWKNIIPVDADGVVLHDSIIWLDSRAIEQAARLNEAVGEFVGTGQEYWPRLLWLKENEPEIWHRADKIIGLNTYLKWRATGRFVTEPSDDFIRSPKPEVADLYTRIIKAAGLVEDLGKFPEQTRSTDIVGSLTAAAARDLGLREGVPVLGGFGDLPAITAGVGRSGFNDVHIYFGTSSWLVSVVPDRSSLDAPLNFSFDADREGAVFALQTGCLAYDWATEQLYRAEKGVLGDSLHDFLAKEVASVEPGSLDLVATHWLAGELPPLSKNAKGIFLNLTTSHDRRHMLRAVMESICYTHRMNLERFSRSTGAQLESIRVVGGGATSGVWMQMLADVLQMRIEVPRAPRYTGALGAYYCAMIGLGQIADYDSIVDEVPIERVFTPNPENEAVYDRLYDVYRQLSPALRDVFDQLNGKY